MAGYVGNLISSHDRREGGLSAFGARNAGTIPDVTGPGLMQGSRADRWARCHRVRHVTGRGVLPPRRSSSQSVPYKEQKVYMHYDKSSHSQLTSTESPCQPGQGRTPQSSKLSMVQE